RPDRCGDRASSQSAHLRSGSEIGDWQLTEAATVGCQWSCVGRMPETATSGREGRSSFTSSAAQAVRGDDLPVALDVVLADVVEQPPAATDHLQQAASGVVVLLVGREVVVEVVDA